MYAVWEIKYSAREFWVAALPLRRIKAASSLCCLVPIITEFWLIYYYIDHLVKQPTYKPSGMSPFSSYLLEPEQFRHSPMDTLFQTQVGSFPCTQGRCSSLPHRSLRRASVIKSGPNDLSLARLQSSSHRFSRGKKKPNRHPTCTTPSGDAGPAPYPNHPRAAGACFDGAGARRAALKLAAPRTPCPRSRRSARCLRWLFL